MTSEASRGAAHTTSSGAAAAYTAFAEAVVGRRRGDGGFLVMGKALAEIAEGEHWTTLGYVSFEECLAAPELGVKRTTAYKAMGVYRVFVQRMAIPQERLVEIGIEKLDVVRKVCLPPTNAQTVDEWLHRAKTLTKNDLRAEVRRITGKEPVETEEELAAHERAVAEALASTLSGGVIREARWSRFRGLELIVETAEGLRELHVWAPDGAKAKIVELGAERLAAFYRESAGEIRDVAAAAFQARLSQPR